MAQQLENVSIIPVAQSEAGALIHMIERVARDPSADLDKLERLMEMRRQIQLEEAEGAFNERMSIVQSKMRAIAADANNPQTKSKYASYFALDKAIRPIYSGEGFGLSFNTEDGAPADYVRVVCYVSRGKFTRKYHVDMPADGKGAKGGDVMTKTHATGAAMTYGQRYLLKMIFNIAIGEDDDQGASTGEIISLENVEQIIALCDEVAADKEALCKYFRVPGIASITVKDFPRVVAALNKKRAKQ